MDDHPTNEQDIWELWAEGKPIATMRLHEHRPPIPIEDNKAWMLTVIIFKDFEELPAFEKYWTRFDEYQDRLDAAFGEEDDQAFEKAYEKSFRIYASWIKPLQLRVIQRSSGMVYENILVQVMDNWTIHVGYDVKADDSTMEE